MSNIQVVVRCRERNTQEIKAKSPIVLELTNDTFSSTESYITINHSLSSNTSSFNNSFSELNNNQKKTYKLDQIYGSQADQSLIYQNIGQPLLRDFLNGMNVTILAYGQTGTGKTYTMCGIDKDCDPNNNELAGIIPRLLRELFENLSSTTENDYIIKISYLEIYNEELIDLLSNTAKKLKIHEKLSSNNKKSKSINISNLSEYCINDLQQGLKFLKMGLNKKKTACTNLNESSSRSHTIFQIKLIKKDNNNDIYRVSKMNLVDLAGSENISRSGSIVKEAGGINQSLLTLGRVINSLTDSKIKHIPYRESKLTHILQDSLGGNTKTTLIATVSPAKLNIVETASTLDYACKAKNIKNLPINGNDSELILKKTLIKNISQELSQMNLDLIASRNKNGIYLDPENYKLLTNENESFKTQLKENNLKIESLNNKCSNLETTKIENQLEINNLLKENLSINEKYNNLKSDYDLLLSKLNEKDLVINKLNGQVNKVLEKSSNSATILVNLLSDHLNSSINLLNNTLNLNNQENATKLSNFQVEFKKKLNKYKQNLQSSIKSYQSKVDSVINKDVQEVIFIFQSNFQSLLKFHNGMHQNSQNIIMDFKIMNEKLSGYLKENYLDDLENNLNINLKNLLNTEFPPMIEKFRLLMNQELTKSINNVMNQYEKVASDEILKEKENILKMESNWHEGIRSILPNFENNLLKQDELFKSTEDNIKHINIKKFEKARLENNIKVDNLPDVSQLENITKEVSNTTNLLNSNLNEINENLVNLQSFDVKDAFKVSPFKERIIQLSHMKNKTTRSRSPSKIPTLHRSKSDLDEETIQPFNKKRKILQPLDSNYL
ncbi:unnamed protein product [Candida verbasci]|uniref:Kinesin-like protein n=1 Tax=Candida verbasci TaxID=1227364 RepID=A0A9W4XJK1_9ASCO|nr:unnamed protein product [Candida verbasci]